MAKKMVLDRSVKLTLEGSSLNMDGQVTTIPDDEVWVGCASNKTTDKIETVSALYKAGAHKIIVGGGGTLAGPIYFTGIVFRLID